MEQDYLYQMRMMAEELRQETDSELVIDLLDILVRYAGGDDDRGATLCGMLAIIIDSQSEQALNDITEGLVLIGLRLCLGGE